MIGILLPSGYDFSFERAADTDAVMYQTETPAPTDATQEISSTPDNLELVRTAITSTRTILLQMLTEIISISNTFRKLVYYFCTDVVAKKNCTRL